MNIAKSLKVKNRLVGEVNKLQDIIKRENSRRSDNVSTVNVQELFDKLHEARRKLVTLKGAISVATAPVSDLLASLAELKAYINWISSLNTREGEERVAFGMKEVETYTWTAHINRANVDIVVGASQASIDNLQDRLDDFNARTQVNWIE